MKILILNYEYPPVGGGGGRAAADVGSFLASRGHEVQVLTSHLEGLPRREVRRGVTIHRVRCLRRRPDRCSLFEMAAFVLACPWPALRLIRRWRPSVIHVHFAVPTGFAGWLISKLTGIPYVMTVQLGDVPGGAPHQTDWIFKFVKPLTVPMWRQAAKVTAVSAYVVDLCREAYGITPVLIHNGIDVASFPVHVRPPSEKVKILWVGRMQHQKNLPGALRQLKMLGDLPWELNVLGDGPERREAEDVVRAAGLTERTFFRGWLDEAAVREYMEGSDILFLPSFSEGLPLVSLQALATGLAIVGSDIGGLEGVIEHGRNGFRCSLDRPSEFQEALRTLVSEPSRLEAMQRASRVMAEKFALERIVDLYEDVLLRSGTSEPRPAHRANLEV